jgi:hypothetical protein
VQRRNFVGGDRAIRIEFLERWNVDLLVRDTDEVPHAGVIARNGVVVDVPLAEFACARIEIRSEGPTVNG